MMQAFLAIGPSRALVLLILFSIVAAAVAVAAENDGQATTTFAHNLARHQLLPRRYQHPNQRPPYLGPLHPRQSTTDEQPDTTTNDNDDTSNPNNNPTDNNPSNPPTQRPPPPPSPPSPGGGGPGPTKATWRLATECLTQCPIDIFTKLSHCLPELTETSSPVPFDPIGFLKCICTASQEHDPTAATTTATTTATSDAFFSILTGCLTCELEVLGGEVLGGGDVGREVLGVVGKVTGRLGGLVEGACKVATDIDFEELGRKIAEPFEDLFGIGGGAGSVGKAVPLGLGGMVVGLVVVVVG